MAQLPQTLYGDGHDDSKTVSGTEILNTYYACTGTATESAIAVASGAEANFDAGDLVLLHKTRGDTTTTAGTWEILTVSSTSDTVVNFTTALVNSYQDSGANQSQAIIIPQYTTFSCPSSQTLASTSWGGSSGGIIAICASESIDIAGTVRVNGAAGSKSSAGGSGGGATGGGYYGGNGTSGNDGSYGKQGEGTAAAAGGNSRSANGNGGGGSQILSNTPASGGGGGNGGAGSNGENGAYGTGGAVDGNAALTEMVFGGGGGGGVQNSDDGAGGGGSGGGIIFLISKNVTFTGAIQVNGGAGANGGGDDDGGGGAGGSVLVKGETVDIGTNKITATAGAGGSNKGGAGGTGRIRIDWGKSFTGSSSSPVDSNAQDTDLIEVEDNNNPAFFSTGGLTIL